MKKNPKLKKNISFEKSTFSKKYFENCQQKKSTIKEEKFKKLKKIIFLKNFWKIHNLKKIRKF